MKRFILFFILLLSACATNEVLYTDANGVTVYKAKCDQTPNMDIGDCLKLVGQQCPFGYNIMMADEKAKGVTTGNQYSAQGSELYSWGGGTLSYNRFIIYTCKIPK